MEVHSLLSLIICIVSLGGFPGIASGIQVNQWSNAAPRFLNHSSEILETNAFRRRNQETAQSDVSQPSSSGHSQNVHTRPQRKYDEGRTYEATLMGLYDPFRSLKVKSFQNPSLRSFQTRRKNFGVTKTKMIATADVAAKSDFLRSLSSSDGRMSRNSPSERGKYYSERSFSSGRSSEHLFSSSSVSKRNMARLSENISAILESLLKDYNNQLRPGLKEGKITTIRMNMLIRSMGPITEKEMRYSMDCYVRQEWHDNRLKFRGPLQQLSLNIKMLEALWKPDTYFHNGHGSYVHTITRPNKLFRIDQNGKILYSMRLTIKAKCPMELKNFPMDKQSCPLLIGSYAYSVNDVKYEWDNKLVSFEPDMTLSQYDLLNTECQNYSAKYRKGGVYSVLQVNFNLQRHTGYFLIQVYIPCILIVVLSWVSFWINREATSDRVGLGITTVLTLSTISLDSRTDLPKVHYATALDWFILMSFGYCIATLLQFAAVHYFTKLSSSGGIFPLDNIEAICFVWTRCTLMVGSGEVPESEEEWQDIDVCESFGGFEDTMTLPSPVTRSPVLLRSNPSSERFSTEDFQSREEIIFLNPRCPIDHDKIEGCIRSHPPFPFIADHQIESFESDIDPTQTTYKRRRQCNCPSLAETPVYLESSYRPSPTIPSRLSVRTMETQTDSHDSFWSQLFHCITGNDQYRKERTRQAIRDRSVNSVSVIDTVSRVLFPASYGLLNLWYWYSYYHTEIVYTWSEPGFDHFDHSYIT